MHTYCRHVYMQNRTYLHNWAHTQYCLFLQYIYRCVHTRICKYFASLCLGVCNVCTCVEGTLQTCVQCDSHQTKETPPEQTLNKEIDALQHPVNDHQHRAINPEDCLSAASHPSLSLSLYILSSSLYSIYIYIHCYLTIYSSLYISLYTTVQRFGDAQIFNSLHL